MLRAGEEPKKVNEEETMAKEEKDVDVQEEEQNDGDAIDDALCNRVGKLEEQVAELREQMVVLQKEMAKKKKSRAPNQEDVQLLKGIARMLVDRVNPELLDVIPQAKEW
jgi:molecular chaperone GrpE (heat shock protein)